MRLRQDWKKDQSRHAFEVATRMAWSKLNFVATLPKFVTTQFKEKAKNFVETIISLL